MSKEEMKPDYFKEMSDEMDRKINESNKEFDNLLSGDPKLKAEYDKLLDENDSAGRELEDALSAYNEASVKKEKARRAVVNFELTHNKNRAS